MSDARPPGPGAGSAAADLVGTVLAGRYRILRKLGEGAMGAVYLGEHLKIGRRDAIKVLRGPMARDDEAIARFNRGARNVAAIQHPNVCAIYDYSDADDGTPFLAMEFVAGESLKELLDREGPLPLLRAADIARQVADALYAAHVAGIVHRDLKPANIMLGRGRDGTDEVRVVDFDIAKGSHQGEEAEVTRLGFVIGTPEYMSPEQLMADRLDGRSDVYSLAIVLFRMLTGALPFASGTGQETIVQRLTQPPLRLVDVYPDAAFPDGLQAVLDRALAREPHQRQPSAAEFARELSEAVAQAAPPRSGSAEAGAVPAAFRPRPGEVPGTRRWEAGVPQTVASPAAAPHRPAPPRRLPVPIAAATAAVALLATLGLGWALLRPTGPAEPDPIAVMPPPAPSPVAAADASAAAPDGTPELSPPTETGPGGHREPVPEPETAPRPDPAPVRATEPPAASTPAAAAPAAPGDVLARHFRDVGPRRSAHQLDAHRDTASLLWHSHELSAQQRARAAFVAAFASHLRGENGECRRWIERALELNSANRTYQSLYRDCGG